MSVQAIFQFEAAEHYRALRDVAKATRFNWVPWALGVALPTVMIIGAVSSGWGRASAGAMFMSILPWVLLGVFYVSLVPLLQWRAARKLPENDPSVRGVQSRSVDESGLHVSGAGLSLHFAWADIRRVVETRDFFLFFYNKRCAHFVPKRVLSPEHISEVQALVAEKAGQTRVA